MSRGRLALALAVVVLAAWAPALRGGFVWDDHHDLVRSDRLHRLGAVVDVFRHHAMWSAEQPETAIATYRPLALATLAVDYAVYGLRPAGFHATNVLLHLLATLAVFLALAALVDARTAAAIALLCALHPADAEAVAWINGRSEMLALGFGAVALWAARRRRPLLVALFLFGALLGKETALVFAPLCLAVAWLDDGDPGDERRPPSGDRHPLHDDRHPLRGDRHPLRGDRHPLHDDRHPLRGDRHPLHPLRAERRALRLSWRPLVPVAAAVTAYAAARAGALGHAALPSAGRAAARALPAVWLRATGAALWPVRTAPVTLSTWLGALSPAARAAWTAGGLALAVLLVLLLARRRWLAALGLAWWLGALLPTAPIAVLDYPWPGLARWLYVGLPGLGLCLAAPARRLAPRARLALVGLAAALCLAGAERGIAAWRSDARLWSAMTAESPDDAWAWRALGMSRMAAARYAEAAACFHRATQVDRTAEVHAAYALEAWAWTYLGRCKEAITQFHAHPITPALSAESFDAAARACQARSAARSAAPPP